MASKKIYVLPKIQKKLGFYKKKLNVRHKELSDKDRQ
jgi:hypothetical protein